MLKKTISFVDFNGEDREEDFYFNLNKAELMEMNLSRDGGMQQFIENIIKTKDTVQIANIFKKIIKASYGVRSDDGKRFIKFVQDKYGNKKYLFDDFEQTNAYEALYMELATNDAAASDFINAVLPKID